MERLGVIPRDVVMSPTLAKDVIAWLTYDNSGVYCEAGYAEGLGKKSYTPVRRIRRHILMSVIYRLYFGILVNRILLQGN